MNFRNYAASIVLAAATSLAVSLPAMAQATVRYDLPAQDLELTLRSIARISGRQIMIASDVIAGRKAPALSGDFTLQEALRRTLEGTGIPFRFAGDTILVGAPAVKGSSGASAADEITVAGSRIRGAPAASESLSYDREAMRDAGQASIAELIRTIPQNFGGGQNPGIGFNVPESRGSDLDGGSSINLRGLGSDATLTLLNGRRLSYSGALQNVDVSAIPFGAVARVDIVPDGASALFGSDAVAGVANIILRRDFTGVETSARLAASSDGGNFQQQYGATLGQAWTAGSAMFSYEFSRNDPIAARQRSYARERSPGVQLYPELERHNAVFSLGHELVPDLKFDIDGLYNKRWHDFTLPLNAAGDLSVSRGEYWRIAESWATSPSLTLSLPQSWEVTLSGSYGSSTTDFGYDAVRGGVSQAGTSGSYRNVTRNVEVSGNGTLANLPAGPLKIALGAGYRQVRFDRRGTSANAAIDGRQNSRYAFGEMSVPLLAPGQSALGHSLDLSLAARYEDYPGVASVTTPKLGLIFAPTADFSIKGTWGRSFRTPTLYEQFRPKDAYLESDIYYGGNGAGNVLYVYGGSRELRPERSESWSAALDLHPQWLDGATLTLTWFDVRYRDRIVTPILYRSRSLTSAAYVPYVTRNPDAAQQEAALDGVTTFANYSDGPYDPASVTAIVANNSVNAGRQSVQGLDLLANYSFAIAGGNAGTSANVSYIESDQQIGRDDLVTPLAGSLFNPPHWRGRFDLHWSGRAFSALAAVNYIGGVRDRRASPSKRVGGMAPVDLTIRYHPTEGGGLASGLDVTASLQNLFNDKPSVIATSSYIDVPYDSTNYSAFGRVLSLMVTKTW